MTPTGQGSNGHGPGEAVIAWTMLRKAITRPLDRASAAASALRTVKTEMAGLSALEAALGNGLAEPFAAAVDLLAGIGGRVIVSGVGKSGHIGSKIAATLASTGTPAFFVHPAEANHGDLGMIDQQDAIVAISWSGETAELKGIVAYARRFAIPIVAITAGIDSALAREASVVIALPKVAEACPHGLAPTTSTLMQLVVGDALAVALLEARGFTTDHFRTFHPGGKLGASLIKVGEIMHEGERLPKVPAGSGLREAVQEISSKGFGCVAVISQSGELEGIVTDGDLRRHMDADLLSRTVDEIMTRTPRTVTADTLVGTALQMVNASSITSLMVVEDRRLVGLVHLHDLLRIGAA